MRIRTRATIALAGVFLCVKYVEYSEKFHHGLFPDTNIFFSLYYMMTGIHGLHVVAGMIVLGYVVVLARRGRLSQRDPLLRHSCRRSDLDSHSVALPAMESQSPAERPPRESEWRR